MNKKDLSELGRELRITIERIQKALRKLEEENKKTETK